MFEGGNVAAPAIMALTIGISLLGLFRLPAIISKFLFRPYFFLRNKQYDTMIMSGFIHADISHLLFEHVHVLLLRNSDGAFYRDAAICGSLFPRTGD